MFGEKYVVYPVRFEFPYVEKISHKIEHLPKDMQHYITNQSGLTPAEKIVVTVGEPQNSGICDPTSFCYNFIMVLTKTHEPIVDVFITLAELDTYLGFYENLLGFDGLHASGFHYVGFIFYGKKINSILFLFWF